MEDSNEPDYRSAWLEYMKDLWLMDEVTVQEQYEEWIPYLLEYMKELDADYARESMQLWAKGNQVQDLALAQVLREAEYRSQISCSVIVSWLSAPDSWEADEVQGFREWFVGEQAWLNAHWGELNKTVESICQVGLHLLDGTQECIDRISNLWSRHEVIAKEFFARSDDRLANANDLAQLPMGDRAPWLVPAHLTRKTL